MSADTVPNTTGYTTYPSSSAPSVTPNPDPNTNPSTLSEQSGATAPDSNLNPRSCVTCRRRKVRCNKREPCSNCVKAGIDCIFPGPGRAPRKQRRPPDVEVLSRLRRLEGVVESLGGTDAIEKLLTAKLGSDSEANNAASPAQASAVENANLPKESDASGQAIWNIASARNNGAYEELGRLVIDESKSAYVSDRFWSSVGNQIEELEGLLDSDSEQEGENTTSPEDSTQSPNNNNHDMFLFGYNSLAKSVSNYHPTPTQVFILWKTYEQNVAPLLTMVHKPTIRNLIINVATNQDPVDKNNEALLFAVYFAAVISMPPEQCLAELGDDRDSAISRFRFATEQALARANLVNSRSINLLQAAVLFISSVHKVDKGRFVWTMTALLLRLATGLGLHRDGTNFGLSPFETEMRRRLWWHIIIVDARTAEDHGTEPMINESMYDTRFPLHINDDDISPESKTFPSGRAAFTDMTFTLIRCHVSQNYRHLTHFSLGRHSIGPTLEECKKTVENLHNTLNENFIQHCDMQEPFQWACATMARLVVAKLWLVVHHPLIKTNLTSLAPEERNKILLTSIEVIEFTRLMETSDATRRWSWLFGSYVQWHAIAFVLAELCVRPRCPGVDRAWLAIDSTFHEWERMSIGKKGPLWRPLKKLYDKAQTFRAARFGPPELSLSAMNLPFNGLNGNIPTIQQQQQQQQQVLLPQKPQSEEQQRNGSTSSSGPYQLDGKSSQLSSPGQTSHDTRPNLSRSAILSQTPARNRTETVNKTIPEFNLDLSKSIPDIMSDFMPTYTMAISDSSGDNILNASDVPNTTTGRNNETTSAFPPPAPPPPPPNAFINNFNPVDNIWPQVTPNTFGMPINWDQLDDVMRDFQQEFEQAAGPDSGEAQIRFM